MMRLAKTAHLSALGRFCANFLNLSNFLLRVKLLFQVRIYHAARPLNHHVGVQSSRRQAEPKDSQAVSFQFLSRSAKLSNSDQHRPSHGRKYLSNGRPGARATGGSRRIASPGLAMACSLKDYLQGSRGFIPTSPDPTNQLPTSHSGQAQRPPGGSIASSTAF